jgi:hypothetical protein
MKHLKNLSKIQLWTTQTTKALSVAQFVNSLLEVAKVILVKPLSPAATTWYALI